MINSLFATYRIMWRQSMLNLKDVVTGSLRKNKAHKQLISMVADKAKWKGKISMLVRRIKRILNNSKLSVREKQDLTRMYKKQVKIGKIDWESILYEFPGKTLIHVKEIWKDIKVKIHPDLPAVKSQNFNFDNDPFAKLSKTDKGSQKGGVDHIKKQIKILIKA